MTITPLMCKLMISNDKYLNKKDKDNTPIEVKALNNLKNHSLNVVCIQIKQDVLSILKMLMHYKITK